MHRIRNLVLILLLCAVFGATTAWATQYLFVHQTSQVMGVSLCIGPTVVGFECPKPTIPVEKRGYPIAFVSQVKPNSTLEVGYVLPEESLDKQFDMKNYVASAIFWGVIIFILGFLAKSIHTRYFVKR